MPKYSLGKITNKYLILEVIFSSFYKQKGFAYLLKASRSLRQLLIENLNAALFMSEDALSHITDLPRTISMIDLPESDGSVHFVLLSGGGDRLYTVADKSLLVYSLSEFASPLASYPIGGNCYAGALIDSRLYLGEN